MQIYLSKGKNHWFTFGIQTQNLRIGSRGISDRDNVSPKAIIYIFYFQPKPAQCRSFIKGMRRFFFCTKTKKRKIVKPTNACKDTVRRRKDGKPAIFTSTVGKASGNKENNPTSMLQDIINQLETHNK